MLTKEIYYVAKSKLLFALFGSGVLSCQAVEVMLFSNRYMANSKAQDRCVMSLIVIKVAAV